MFGSAGAEQIDEIFLQDRAHCMNAVVQIMEMRARGAVNRSAYVQT